MYRARVEAVSGLQVKAGGKWLTCIGNRVVRAGDIVWTDGRCVYGNDRESSAPIIATPTKEDWGIPVVMNSPSMTSYYTLRTNGKLLDEHTQITANDALFVNGLRKTIFCSNGILAANIDKQGNLYTIATFYRSVYSTLSSAASLCYLPTTVAICRNDTALSIISLVDLYKELGTQIVNDTAVTGKFRTDIIAPDLQGIINWGAIEDSSNWAFVVYVRVSRSGGGADDMGVGHWMDQLFRHSCVGFTNAFYLYTPKGRQDLAMSTFLFRKDEWTVGHFSEEHSYSPRGEMTTPSVQFPIQDGYYFVVNNLTASNFKTDWGGLVSNQYVPKFANISICTPHGSRLLTSDFVVGTRFAIHKGRLLAINDMGGRGFDDSRSEHGTHPNGLYSLNNNTLSMVAAGDISNQTLRPMKRHRNWWDRITSFDVSNLKIELPEITELNYG